MERSPKPKPEASSDAPAGKKRKARERLYLEILTQSQTRKETLDSAEWDVPLIQKRLQNALAKQNRTAAAAEAEDAD